MIKILFSGVVSSKKNPKSKEFRYLAEKTMAITKKMKLNQGNIFLLKNKNMKKHHKTKLSQENISTVQIF